MVISGNRGLQPLWLLTVFLRVSYLATPPYLLWLHLNMETVLDVLWLTVFGQPQVFQYKEIWCVPGIQHSPGDHWAFIVDVHLLDTIGKPQFTISHLPAQKIAVQFLHPQTATSKCLIYTASIINCIKNLMHCFEWHKALALIFNSSKKRWRHW